MRRTLLAAVVLGAVLAAGAPEARADWSLSVSWSPYSSYRYAPAYQPAVYPAWSYPAYSNYYGTPAYYYPASYYYAPAYYYSPAPVFYYSCYRPWGYYPHHQYGGPMFGHGPWGWGGGFSYARWGHHRGWSVGWGW